MNDLYVAANPSIKGSWLLVGTVLVVVRVCASCMVELLQLIFKRGLFELDDIIHNTPGVAVGMADYYVIKKICNGIRR